MPTTRRNLLDTVIALLPEEENLLLLINTIRNALSIVIPDTGGEFIINRFCEKYNDLVGMPTNREEVMLFLNYATFDLMNSS